MSSTSENVRNGHAPGELTTPSPRITKDVKNYRHIYAVHAEPKASCLSHESTAAPSFVGFRNLMVLILVVGNLRLVIENLRKYGVLICLKCHNYGSQDLILGTILFFLVPCHLFIAFSIEAIAASHAKDVQGRRKRDQDGKFRALSPASRPERDPRWKRIALAHGINATFCLSITSVTVYYFIHHPMIGTISQLHAIILGLKICSYAFTNRDLRHAYLHPEEKHDLPPSYISCPYPRNITLSNLCYFWWVPTLCYQPAYPRTTHIRWGFVVKRLAEVFILSIFIWFASAQYAAPLLKNSLDKIAQLDLLSILERLMKLSTISSIIWLAGFFAIFQSTLNALAEVTMFADREFYSDWWNSQSMASFWRLWNRPVYLFMRRHVHSPLVGRGWPTWASSLVVFTISAVLHEVLVGLPTHNIIGEQKFDCRISKKAC